MGRRRLAPWLRFQLFRWAEWWRAHVRTAPGEIAPRLYLPEQHRRAIKTVTTVGSYAGAVLALFTIPQPVNIVVAVGLLALERTLNRVIYRFQTLFVPRPILRKLGDIGLDHFLVAEVHEPAGHPPIVFLGFATYDGARELFSIFASWCGRRVADAAVDDREPGRIGLSIVFEDPQTYRLFVYRTATRPAGDHGEAGVGTDQLDELVQVSVIQSRPFPVVGPAPAALVAQRLLGDGQEYVLAAARVVGGQQVVPCVGLPRFGKRGFRIRSKSQLTRAADPMEYVAYLLMDMHD